MILTALILPGLLLSRADRRQRESPAEASRPAAAAAADATPVDAKPADAAAPAVANARRRLRSPPGFKPMKRGKYILYCRKETVMGTRFRRRSATTRMAFARWPSQLREEREKI